MWTQTFRYAAAVLPAAESALTDGISPEPGQAAALPSVIGGPGLVFNGRNEQSVCISTAAGVETSHQETAAQRRNDKQADRSADHGK